MTRQQLLTMIFMYTLVVLALMAGGMYIMDYTDPIALIAFLAIFLIAMMLWINANKIFRAIFKLIYKEKLGTRKSNPNNRLGNR